MDQPAEYAASNCMVVGDVKDLIEEFLEDFRNMNGRIIDIGCGPGNITESLLCSSVAEDATIVGADISPAMIEYAKKHSSIENRISYLQLDIETSELPESLVGQFDNAVSFYCLHWCRSMKTPLRNIYELLRPGGKAIVLLISHHLIFDIYLEQQKVPKFTPYMQDTLEYLPPHQGHPNAEEMMREDLKEAGLKVLHCSNKWKTYPYPNLDAFLDVMMTIHPFHKRMPDDLRKAYREDMGKRLMKKYIPKKIDGIDDSTFVWRMAMLSTMFEKPHSS